MTRADLLALAERAERAEGADRELDAEIAKAVMPGVWLSPDNKQMATPGGWKPLTPFTASLDAALSEALKNGFVAALGCIVADGLPGCCICTSTDPVREVWGVSTGGGDDQIGRLARAAIAAALRAHAEEAADGE